MHAMRSNKPTRTRSDCPNCSLDLAHKPSGSKPPYTRCPRCDVALVPVWWQRLLWAAVATAFSFLLPASIGIGGVLLLICAVVCWLPVFVITGIWIFRLMPAKYVAKNSFVTTLLRR